jgi:hypothetical protein
MRTMTERAVLSSLASVVIVLALPARLSAQLASARPASVALTVVVPTHPQSGGLTSLPGRVSRLGTTATSVDFETMVDLVDRAPARLEVRLGETWSAESTRVLVRNARGDFQRLLRGAGFVTVDALSQSASMSRAPLRFRIESAPLDASSLAIPLEYRLTVGRGDEFSVWSFSSLLRLDAKH